MSEMNEVNSAPLLTEFWMLALFHCVPFAAGVGMYGPSMQRKAIKKQAKLVAACFAALRSIICVELLGIEKLTNAYGMLMLFMGVAALLGPPFAAALKNLTNSFDASFVVMGAIMLVSGLLSLPLRRVNKWELSRAAAATHCFTATELESLRGREEATQLEPLSGREETAEKKV
jgi:MFS family permease